MICYSRGELVSRSTTCPRLRLLIKTQQEQCNDKNKAIKYIRKLRQKINNCEEAFKSHFSSILITDLENISQKLGKQDLERTCH